MPSVTKRRFPTNAHVTRRGNRHGSPSFPGPHGSEIEPFSRQPVDISTGIVGVPQFFDPLRHGNPTSSYLWRNVLPRVARETGRRGVALDLLGFGKSEKPSSVKYGLSLHARIVEGFVLKLGLRDLVTVADDWGGPLVANYAIDHTEKPSDILIEWIRDIAHIAG